MEQGRWLTVEEAAEHLRVAPKTVRRWLQAGLLEGAKLPGKAGWRIPASELDRFLQERSGQRLDRPAEPS